MVSATSELSAAEQMRGQDRLPLLDRAHVRLMRALEIRPASTDAAAAAARVQELRNQSIEETRRDVHRRTRNRVGTVAALLLVLGGIFFASSLASEREETARQRDRLMAARQLAWSQSPHLWPISADSVGLYEDLVRVTAPTANRADAVRRLEELRGRALPASHASSAAGHRPTLEALESIDFTLAVMEKESARYATSTDPAVVSALQEVAAYRPAFLAERERLVGTLGEPRAWRFASRADQREHDYLEILVGLAGGEGTDLHRALANRLRIARLMADAREANRKTWTDVLRRALPTVEGLEFVPPPGDLIPLGQSRESGLFEFAHVGSGTIPVRSPETGEVVIENDTCIVFVLLPGGQHWVGSQSTDAEGQNYYEHASPAEQPVHLATIEPVFLAKTECTWHQLYELTKYEADAPNSPLSADPFFAGEGPRHPVRRMSHDGAARYLGRFNMRLPFDFEWEWAAHGGRRPYSPWGTGNGEASLQGHANLYDQTGAAAPERPYGTSATPMPWKDGFVASAPVASFRPSRWGFYDLYGNVAEVMSAPARTYSPVFLVGGQTVDQSEARGGSFLHDAGGARTSLRWFNSVVEYPIQNGFRPARVLDPSTESLAARYMSKELQGE